MPTNIVILEAGGAGQKDGGAYLGAGSVVDVVHVVWWWCPGVRAVGDEESRCWRLSTGETDEGAGEGCSVAPTWAPVVTLMSSTRVGGGAAAGIVALGDEEDVVAVPRPCCVAGSRQGDGGAYLRIGSRVDVVQRGDVGAGWRSCCWVVRR